MNERVFGDTVWMTTDLAVTVTNRGEPLLLADTDEAWARAFNDRVPAYRPSAHAGRGMLYNQFALGEIAPDGWRVAQEADWQKLATLAEADSTAAAALDFSSRRGLGHFWGSSREDERTGGYWCNDWTSGETWGNEIDALRVSYFTTCTRWGAICDFGLFVRCVRPV